MRNMFCCQCQETADNKGCTVGGRCGKNAETANLMDTLISELKTLSLVLEGKNGITREYSRFICRAMFATLTNTNFNPERIQNLIDEARRAKFALDNTFTPPERGCGEPGGKDFDSLRELLIYGIKGISAYAFHALALGREDVSVYDFVIRALAATAKKETTEEKLFALVNECGVKASVILACLDSAHTEKIGIPSAVTVKNIVGKNPAILVTGHDMVDLLELLEQTEGKGIDVYTHGEMLPAHAYPKLRRFKHLIGNYGSSWFHQDKEFDLFRGAILVTTNCLIPVRPAYKDRLFTTGMAGYPGIPHITHRHAGGKKDFSAVIAKALTLPPPAPLPDSVPLTTGFGHEQLFIYADKLVELLKAKKLSRFIVMAGCDGRHATRSYYTELAEKLPQDTIILTAGCAKYRFNSMDLGNIEGIPRIIDAGQCNDSYSLIRIACQLQEMFDLPSKAELPVSFVLAWYEQKAVAVLLALLALGFRNIRLGPTLPAFLSPGVTDVLVKNYGIKPVTTVKDDLPNILSGK